MTCPPFLCREGYFCYGFSVVKDQTQSFDRILLTNSQQLFSWSPNTDLPASSKFNVLKEKWTTDRLNSGAFYSFDSKAVLGALHTTIIEKEIVGVQKSPEERGPKGSSSVLSKMCSWNLWPGFHHPVPPPLLAEGGLDQPPPPSLGLFMPLLKCPPPYPPPYPPP